MPDPAAWLVPPAVTLRVAVALILVEAALPKLRDRVSFRGIVANYRLLPAALAAPAADALPFAEILLAGALLGWWAGGAVLPAAALLCLFALAMAINLRRGRHEIACGCRGGLSQAIGWPLVARNLVLATLLAASARAEAGVPALPVLILGTVGGLIAFGAHVAFETLSRIPRNASARA